MNSKTPLTDETARRTNTLIASLAIHEYDHLARQLETKLTELASAAKDVQDSIIAAANHEGREQNWLLKLRRMSEAISTAMPNAPAHRPGANTPQPPKQEAAARVRVQPACSANLATEIQLYVARMAHPDNRVKLEVLQHMNDQIATLLRMWWKQESADLAKAVSPNAEVSDGGPLTPESIEARTRRSLH